MKSGNNYRKLVTKITGKNCKGDSFDRVLIHNLPEEVDKYVEYLYCYNCREVKILDTKKQEVTVIDTLYDETVNKTRKLMYEYFMDRVYDVEGEYLCDCLSITPETLKGQLNYLLGEV